MDRRKFIAVSTGALVTLSPSFSDGREDNKFGGSRGYPTGWHGGWNRDPAFRVGNYSGGYDQMLPYRLIPKSTATTKFERNLREDFRYRWGLSTRSVKDYLDRWPTTGLLICKNNQILVEQYRFGRTDSMRLTGMSMAKSVTSLLLGICLDRKLIRSFDDTAATYVPELAGTLHGEVTLRNLSNMSSGAEISHDSAFLNIYTQGLFTPNMSVPRLVGAWNQRKEAQGTRFNYNDLCPFTVGMVIRKVTGRSMSEFAAEALWAPLGMEADATWMIDSEGNEINSLGFAAVLRDWGRLGLLVANKGRAGDNQVVSESWIRECASWGSQDRQVRSVSKFGQAYKAFFWHWKSDGSRPTLSGFHGQRIFIDLPSKVVLVHTAVDHDGDWQTELNSMIDSAAAIEITP